MRGLLRIGLTVAALSILAAAAVSYTALRSRSSITPAASNAINQAAQDASAIAELAVNADLDIDGREQLFQSIYLRLDGFLAADARLREGSDRLPDSFLRRLPPTDEIDALSISIDELAAAEPATATAALARADLTSRADLLAGRLSLVEGAVLRRQGNLDDRAELGLAATIGAAVTATAVALGLVVDQRRRRRQTGPADGSGPRDPAEATPSPGLDQHVLVVDESGVVTGLGVEPGARVAAHVHPDDLDRVQAMIDPGGHDGPTQMRWWHQDGWRTLLGTVAARSAGTTTIVVIDAGTTIEAGPDLRETTNTSRVSTWGGVPAGVAHDLRDAIARNHELDIEYRPVAPIAGGPLRLLIAEVVWDHPAQGRIEAETVAPLAEAAGMGARLTTWALDRASFAAQRLHHEGLSAPIAVRISPSLVLRDDLADRLAGVLRDRGLPGSALMVAVSQNAVIATPTLTRTQLGRIRDLGVGIVILDVDATSVRDGLLDGVPADIIAIDPRSVVDALRSPDRTAISIMADDAVARGADLAALNLRNQSEAERAGTSGVTLGAGPWIATSIVLDDLVSA